MYEKIFRKFGPLSLSGSFIGKLFLFFAIGIYFSVDLAVYSYKLLLVIVVLLIYYAQTCLIAWRKDEKTSLNTHLVGTGGVVLLTLLLGIQSPHVPYAYPLILGLVFIALSLFYLRGGK